MTGSGGTGRRDRLGRGLGALLGDYLERPPADGTTPTRIPVSAIVPNPYQPRREFAERELAELAESIRDNGLLQPIVVRPAPGAPDRWELVAGERRWRAVTRLSWPDVPAVVREVDDRTLLVLALVENLQRSELSPMEEAAAYQRLIDEFSATPTEIARALGRDRSTVSNTLRLLQLPASVQQLVAEGKLSAGHARALLGLAGDRRMGEVARRAVDEGWSVREIEAWVQQARGRAAAPRKAPREGRLSATERRLEEELQRALGTGVKVRRGPGSRGRVEIPFYGPEDFERLFELLVGRSVAEVVS